MEKVRNYKGKTILEAIKDTIEKGLINSVLCISLGRVIPFSKLGFSPVCDNRKADFIQLIFIFGGFDMMFTTFLRIDNDYRYTYLPADGSPLNRRGNAFCKAFII